MSIGRIFLWIFLFPIMLPLYLVQKLLLKGEEAKQERYKALTEMYGEETATRIMQKVIQQGDSPEIVIAVFGKPLKVESRVFKDRQKDTYNYKLHNGRYKFKVHFENNIVIGWDDRRS